MECCVISSYLLLFLIRERRASQWLFTQWDVTELTGLTLSAVSRAQHMHQALHGAPQWGSTAQLLVQVHRGPRACGIGKTPIFSWCSPVHALPTLQGPCCHSETKNILMCVCFIRENHAQSKSVVNHIEKNYLQEKRFPKHSSQPCNYLTASLERKWS